ncbi:MAG: DUF4335 domain-containing protein [Phormidesmis sp.]
MTIRRQYQLPNCSIILDGLSIDPSPGSENVMSLLVNAECRISGLERSLNGGYNFFAALVRAVSQYGQEVLSGFAHPQVVEGEPLLVHINPGDGPYHHLVVQPEIADLGDASDGRAIDIKLSSVQLFDLTEAVDQFFDDKQPLPELEPSLTPLGRRFVRSDEPLSDRAVPAVLGIGGLVAATLAFGLLPMPEVRDPALETRETIESVEVADADTDRAGATPPTGETPELEDSESAVEVSEPESNAFVTDSELTDSELSDSELSDGELSDGDADESSDELAGSDAESPNEANSDAEAEGDELAVAAAGATEFDEEPFLNSSLQFSDIRLLNGQLKQTIVENRDQPRFGDAISYRVRLSEEGNILGYQPADRAAGSAVDETPLPELVDADAESDNIMDYRVVFTERGVVEVSPWFGWSYYE